MPISSDRLAAIQETIDRIAAESILAQAGRDDGLVPAYSLLGELNELCADVPALASPVAAVRNALEKRLDEALPFDESTLGQLRGLVERLPVLLAQPGANPVAVGIEPPPSTGARPAPAAATDEVMSLNLDGNRELLTE